MEAVRTSTLVEQLQFSRLGGVALVTAEAVSKLKPAPGTLHLDYPC